MLQVGGGLDLGQEPLRAEDRRELGPEHLERDLPVVPQVVREVDRGHAALPDLALEAVPVGERGRQVRERLGHGPGSGVWGSADVACRGKL